MAIKASETEARAAWWFGRIEWTINCLICRHCEWRVVLKSSSTTTLRKMKKKISKYLPQKVRYKWLLRQIGRHFKNFNWFGPLRECLFQVIMCQYDTKFALIRLYISTKQMQIIDKISTRSHLNFIRLFTHYSGIAAAAGTTLFVRFHIKHLESQFLAHHWEHWWWSSG